jgi:endonuclease/exonuclease/phosphatase family metal-dependent hydrolase
VKINATPFPAFWGIILVCWLIGLTGAEAQSNVILRVMASNLSSGNNQRYETPGLNILEGLNPDIVAMQEFNVSNSFGVNTPAALSNMVATTFGPDFVYFRESGYAIPNGIISRYPMFTNGSWMDSDTGVNDRGFAWAGIDLPGTNDLYVVSVHLKASSGSTNPARRAAQAAELRDLISTNFPANAWVIVAGDFNIYDQTEPAVATFATFLSDDAVPADQNGNQNTNAGRSERYDRVLLSPSMTNSLMPVVMPSHTYTDGLVFDSRIYTSLTDVPPVLTGDSGVSGMQHMGVVKAIKILLANPSPPALPPTLSSPIYGDGQFQFLLTGTIGASYIVQGSSAPSAATWSSLRQTAPLSPSPQPTPVNTSSGSIAAWSHRRSLPCPADNFTVLQSGPQTLAAFDPFRVPQNCSGRCVQRDRITARQDLFRPEQTQAPLQVCMMIQRAPQVVTA